MYDITETEALDEIERLRSLLDAAMPVVKAAIENTKAVKKWRTYKSGLVGSQKEAQAITAVMTETREKLDVAVYRYENAPLMARLQAALANLDNEAELQTSMAAYSGT